MPLNLEPVLDALASRFAEVRSGLDVGFVDESVTEALRAARGGVWMSVNDGSDLPFDNEQFEVVVMNGAVVSPVTVKEANRVLREGGVLIFSVPERTRTQEGFSLPEVYRMIRGGFDIVELDRPGWWWFGFKSRTLTVTARKKAWRERKNFLHDGSLPFTPIREK